MECNDEKCTQEISLVLSLWWLRKVMSYTKMLKIEMKYLLLFIILLHPLVDAQVTQQRFQKQLVIQSSWTKHDNRSAQR